MLHSYKSNFTLNILKKGITVTQKIPVVILTMVSYGGSAHHKNLTIAVIEDNTEKCRKISIPKCD
jgi:hypothetical protein